MYENPLPADWTPKQDASFLREYNNMGVMVLSIHEATPGHFMQIAHANRYESTLRAVLSSGMFIEGWAVYSEGVMQHYHDTVLSFGSPPVHYAAALMLDRDIQRP